MPLSACPAMPKVPRLEKFAWLDVSTGVKYFGFSLVGLGVLISAFVFGGAGEHHHIVIYCY